MRRIDIGFRSRLFIGHGPLRSAFFPSAKLSVDKVREKSIWSHFYTADSAKLAIIVHACSVHDELLILSLFLVHHR